MYDYLQEPASDRKILWVYDPIGNTGKSKFAKYLCWIGIAHILGWDNSVNLAHARRVNKDKTIF